VIHYLPPNDLTGQRAQASPQTPRAVRLTDVTKQYGRGRSAVAALDRITLTVAAGEFVCVVGASGCGKSSLLSLIAGIDRPSAGELSTGGQRVALMFQESALFPWLTAAGNVELALRARSVPRSERRLRATRLLQTVGLADFADKRPHQLSGGMQQRVALARALAQDADVLLMDEPFGALDAQTRVVMQELLIDIWEQRRTTVLFVTHDIDEAIFLSDVVYVLSSRPGRVQLRLEIDLPRPRTLDTMAEPRFGALKRDILGIIHRESLREAGLV
jgi:NitT/TauT family transport system ATP-binding protein